MDNIVYDKNIFAANLQRLMKRDREKQVDVARLLDVSKSTVSAYCSGAQMPRMDKLEVLARHFGVTIAELVESGAAAREQSAAPSPSAEVVRLPSCPAADIYYGLNRRGQAEYLRYGEYLSGQAEFRAERPVRFIKRYIVPAAAGYASPIEGEDFEQIECPADAPLGADFCINIQGDSMEPYIHDGQLVYVKRDTPLHEFDVGIFFVDGDVYCKQWCRDYAGTLHLLSANPRRQDANIELRGSSGRSVVCFGRVLLPHKLPKPSYV